MKRRLRRNNLSNSSLSSQAEQVTKCDSNHDDGISMDPAVWIATNMSPVCPSATWKGVSSPLVHTSLPPPPAAASAPATAPPSPAEGSGPAGVDKAQVEPLLDCLLGRDEACKQIRSGIPGVLAALKAERDKEVCCLRRLKSKRSGLRDACFDSSSSSAILRPIAVLPSSRGEEKSEDGLLAPLLRLCRTPSPPPTPPVSPHSLSTLRTHSGQWLIDPDHLPPPAEVAAEDPHAARLQRSGAHSGAWCWPLACLQKSRRSGRVSTQTRLECLTYL